MYARYVPPAKGPEAPPSRPNSVATAKSVEHAPPSSEPATVGGAGFAYSRYIPGSSSKSDPISMKSAATSQLVTFDDEETAPSAPAKRKRAVVEDGKGTQGNDVKKPKKKRKSETEVFHEEAEDAILEVVPPMKSKEKKKDKKSKKNHDEAREMEDKPSSPGNGEEPEMGGVPTTEDDALVPVVDEETTASTPRPEKEPRRKKKKKEKRGDEEDTQMGDAVDDEGKDEDEVAKRHKVVMERRARSLKFASKVGQDAPDEAVEEEPIETHDLEPLPQPDPSLFPTPNPTYETLPSWLAEPIRVSRSTKRSFTDLGVLPKAARLLEEKGYSEAFAVQTAALPLLFPSAKHQPGDLLISAATGSGKTFAYALPITRDISQGVVTRLRALVVLPTRELVRQAQEVFELCSRAYEGGERKRVRIGTGIGSQTLKNEQELLVEREQRWDPDAFREVMAQNTRKETTTDNEPTHINAIIGDWEGQIVEFSSKVDVLICTPGRLVEHIEHTPGFSLDYVRWLVVDEADKLLSQSYQGWLDVVFDKFKTKRFTARELPDMDYSGVRKVVLSATLTRDLGLLNQLALRRPKLIMLEGQDNSVAVEHNLPEQLSEFAIRVHNASLKPMYLLELLRSQAMKSRGADLGTTAQNAEGDDDTSSSSDSDSDDTSDTSDSDDTSSDSDSPATGKTKNHLYAQSIPVCIIFTKSEENALRLSRLLAILDKRLESHIATLTSATSTRVRRKTLRAFTTPNSPTRLIVASDLVARGIDLPKLENVINYDLPASVAGYVHRVGRTARAGRKGAAWTLVDDGESGWYWGKIAKSASIGRAQKVERVRIEEMSDEKVAQYESALSELGQEATKKERKR